MSFAKLDSGIVHSTIWVQPHDVLRVWIWFLSQCDARGVIRAAAPAISLACMVPVERMREILHLLESPDEDSRTPDHDGRRIERIDGGWKILNYGKYRESREPEARRNYQREWDRQHRPSGHARKVRPQSDHSPKWSDQARPETTEAEAEAEEAKDEHPNGCLSPAAPPTDPADGDGDDPPGAPRCPVSRIVAEYHRVLPMLAPVRALPEQAARMLRARWRESAERQSVEWWTGFFEFVKRCPLLVGQVNDFQADLLWLVRPTNFAKTLNGNYERRSEG